MIECFFEKAFNLIMIPFKIILGIAVTVLIGAAFVAWWGAIFGSIVPALLIIIFAPDLLLLPLLLAFLYTPVFMEMEGSCTESSSVSEVEDIPIFVREEVSTDDPLLWIFGMMVGIVAIRAVVYFIQN